MPIIKSAVKRNRQNDVRRKRRAPVKSKLKTVLKAFFEVIKNGDKDEAAKKLPHVYSVIDIAVKKKIVHPNNGDRKKARAAKALAEMK